eukprot:8922273-Pyramimonas_sp.AAC.1
MDHDGHPKAQPAWSHSRSSPPRSALRPRQVRNASVLYRLGEIMITSSRIKHVTASRVSCSAFSLPPFGLRRSPRNVSGSAELGT